VTFGLLPVFFLVGVLLALEADPGPQGTTAAGLWKRRILTQAQSVLRSPSSNPISKKPDLTVGERLGISKRIEIDPTGLTAASVTTQTLRTNQ
jgi:hypothetical protein